MRYIKIDENLSYVDFIINMIKDFDSYKYMSDKINMIVNEIDEDIDYVDFYSNENEKGIRIILNNPCIYGFNYDYKNYSLLSFSCTEITISSNDSIIKFNDDIILDISVFGFRNFKLIDKQ